MKSALYKNLSLAIGTNRAVGSFIMVGEVLGKNVSHHGWLTKKNLAKAVP